MCKTIQHLFGPCLQAWRHTLTTPCTRSCYALCFQLTCSLTVCRDFGPPKIARFTPVPMAMAIPLVVGAWYAPLPPSIVIAAAAQQSRASWPLPCDCYTCRTLHATAIYLLLLVDMNWPELLSPPASYPCIILQSPMRCGVPGIKNANVCLGKHW